MPAPTTAKTTMPVAPLKIIYLKGSEEIADAVNQYLIRRRRDLSRKNKDLEMCPGYLESTYLIRTHYSRFGTGEGRVRLDDSIRGTDLFIIGDVTNYTQTLKVCGHENRMSPDNYFQDIKRIISAVSGKAHRISVVLPLTAQTHLPRVP